jgi:hypothetical protein
VYGGVGIQEHEVKDLIIMPTRTVLLFNEFRGILAEAQKQRPARSGQYTTVTIKGNDRQEPAWAVFEVNAMRDAVNRIRALDGQAEVSNDDLWGAETSASGHSDYSFKFVLYCVELALYGKMIGP